MILKHSIHILVFAAVLFFSFTFILMLLFSNQIWYTVQVRTRSPGPWIWSWRTWSCCAQMEVRPAWTSTSAATWQPSPLMLWWYVWRTSAASGSSWNVYRSASNTEIVSAKCVFVCVSVGETGWVTHPVLIPRLHTFKDTHVHSNTHTCLHALSPITHFAAECVWQCHRELQPVQLSRLWSIGSALQWCHPPPAEGSG